MQREHAVVQKALSTEKNRNRQYLANLRNSQKRETRAKRSKRELQKKLAKLHNGEEALSGRLSQRSQELAELTATYSRLLVAHSATLGELDCLTRKSRLFASEHDLACSALAASCGNLDDALLSCSELVQYNNSLRLELSNAYDNHAFLQSDVMRAQHAAAHAYMERNYAIGTSRKNEVRAVQAEHSASGALAKLDSAQTDLGNARSAMTRSKMNTDSTLAAYEEAQSALDRSNTAQDKLRIRYQQAQKKLRALKAVKKCAPTLLTQRVRENILQEDIRCRKASPRRYPGAGRSRKDAYKDSQRALARSLVLAGCTQKSVGEIIVLVGAALGIKVDRKMSRRTVHRCITEGGIASQIQVGHEIRNTESACLLSDEDTPS